MPTKKKEKRQITNVRHERLITIINPVDIKWIKRQLLATLCPQI
jgi:hypothetical protein